MTEIGIKISDAIGAKEFSEKMRRAAASFQEACDAIALALCAHGGEIKPEHPLISGDRGPTVDASRRDPVSAANGEWFWLSGLAGPLGDMFAADGKVVAAAISKRTWEAGGESFQARKATCQILRMRIDSEISSAWRSLCETIPSAGKHGMSIEGLREWLGLQDARCGCRE